MFALTLDDEQRKEVRAMAYRRFLSDRMSVMYLIREHGKEPTSWNSEEEEELRAWLKEHYSDEEDQV